MEVVIVTGLSGAGKSQAINCIEDLGYYCIDNIPPALIQAFLSMCVQGKTIVQKAAFVIDIRGGKFFDDLKNCLIDLKTSGLDYKIMFLEASEEVLIRRFNETRRTHPLAEGKSITEGIKKEKEKLLELRNMADYIIDTSSMKTAMLNEEIKKLLLVDKERENFTITVKSFGYKYGIPLDADIVLDMRFLPNPYYLASMKKLTGNSKKVRKYVMKFQESQQFLKMVNEMINYLIPLYMKEGKPHLVIAFGCTGGQHRSVTMANVFSDLFLEQGKRVITIHRDL